MSLNKALPAARRPLPAKAQAPTIPALHYSCERGCRKRSWKEGSHKELFFSFVVFVPLWFKAFLLFATASGGGNGGKCRGLVGIFHLCASLSCALEPRCGEAILLWSTQRVAGQTKKVVQKVS